MQTRSLIYVLTGIVVAIILVIGGIVIASSGGDDDDGTGVNTGDDTSPEDTGDDGGDDTGDDDGGDDVDLGDRVEGELRLFGPDPITLDPACASDASSAEYIVEVFSGLLSFDRDLNIVNDIAEDYEVSDDGTVYTFHLRTNVTFQDGSRRVSAEDFKFSMERALNPDTQSTVGDVYLDDFVGVEEFIAGDAEEVSGIRVVDPNTLELTIKEPNAVFLQKLTYPTAFVVDQRQVGQATCFEGANWTRDPNGTGPFKLTEWDLGRRITLEPNSSYYLDPRPTLARVTYVLSGGSSFVMYENDEVDITGIGINNIERVLDPSDPLNADLQESESLDVSYIGFNLDEPPFDDPDVRLALNMAIDKEFLASDFLEGLVVPAKGVLPPGIPGYNEGLEGIPFDPEAAKDLLDEAGGPGILDGITLLTSGQGATPADTLEAITAMWRENLGVDITIEQEDFALFLRDLDEGNFQMFSLGWIADYPDPQNFLDIKFHSGSGNNETAYSNPEVDALLDEARSDPDQQTRYDLYQQAEEIIVQDSAWIPLFHGKSTYLVKPYVEGFEFPPFVIPKLKYVSINQ